MAVFYIEYFTQFFLLAKIISLISLSIFSDDNSIQSPIHLHVSFNLFIASLEILNVKKNSDRLFKHLISE